jgi:tetratricopeptide (TPR) repeat protein
VRYLAGELDASERARFEAHLPSCADCARTVAGSLGGPPEAAPSADDAPGPPGTFPRGATVGRYIILSLLGRGGMGEVYSAYDPRLDRKVALKLLRETPGDASSRATQERLLREAQSTARLSHRNVVVVYDTGTIENPAGGARVYLAMELVDGQTLAAYLAERRRSWREVRELFLAAAEGLQAAHDAGLVHRDFKPQNVMVGRDGTVRVMDFGLAGDGTEGGADDLPAIDLTSPTPPSSQTVALTHTGVFLGTPLYMAPEQFLGRKTDARTDQFSFCIAMYEALCGERPFASGSLGELVQAVSTGQVREAPKGSSVPVFLRRLFLRGLHPEPDSRFASMRELTAALRADPLRYRRSVAIAAAAVVALVVTGTGAQRALTRGQRMCRGGAEKLQGIWELKEGGPRRTSVQRAFLGSGSPIAEDTWVRVARLLDDYVRRWTAVYTDTCEATHVRGDQSAEVLDLRMTCLDGERRALRALTNVFSNAEARTIVQGVDAVRALPAIERCTDVAALREVVSPPTDPTARLRIAAVETRLAETKALTDTGQWSRAYAAITPLVEEARSLRYEPLLAGALAAQGWLALQLGHWSAGQRMYEEAVRVSLATRRDDVAAEAATQMVAGLGSHTLDESLYWEALAAALVRRLGPGHGRIWAWFHHNRGVALCKRGEFREGDKEISIALALKRATLPAGDPDIAISLTDLGYLHAQMGDGEAALAATQEALDIDRNAYGSQSPILCRSLTNRGVAFRVLHRYQEAENDLRSSVSLATALAGPDNVRVSESLTDLGETLVEERKFREAEPLLASAMKIREGVEAPWIDDRAQIAFALARARWALDHDRSGARALAVTALDAYRTLPGYQRRADEIEAWLSDKPDPGMKESRGGLPRR